MFSSSFRSICSAHQVASAWLLMLVCLCGCQYNNPLLGRGSGAWQQPGQLQAYSAQLRDLEQRSVELDSNNRDLHTQLAQSQQQQQLLREQVELLQKRLNETATQLRDAQVAKQDLEQKSQALLASTERRGGAMITANNSWRNSLKLVDIAGLEVRQEADVVRIVLPGDQLFRPGSAELQGTASALMDKAAQAIATHYSKQLVVVEAHTDSAALQGTGFVSHHQLSAAQSIVVLDHLTRRSQLPAKQLSVMAYGSNHPRASNGTPAGQAENRRIELVVYPESL